MSLAALDVSAVLLCAAVVVVGAATCLAGMFLFVVFPVGGTPLKRVPGPPSTSFLLGNMREIFDRVGNFPDPFLSWMNQFGGAVHYRIACQRRLQLTDPAAVQFVLATHASTFPRHPTLRRFFTDFLSGEGLLSSEGCHHDYHRKVLNPHFNLSQIKSSIAVFADQTLRFCASHLDDGAAVTAAGRAVNMNSFFQALTLNNVGLTAFGYDFQSNPDAIVAFDELQAMPNKLLLACSMCIPGFSWLPFPSFRRRHHARAKLLCIMQDIIDRKLATGPTTSTSTTPRDLLDRMLEAGTSTHDAVVHTLTVMFAGHDTTTAALCWTFYRLACEPSQAALARRECLHLLDVHGSFDQWQALHDLTYTTAFIQETLRLHPPVPFIGRRMARDDVDVPMSDGSSVFVSKGTSVCVVHAAMQRDPTYWAHPNDFVPERFVPGTCAYAADLGLRHGRGHAVHYMPFSAGSKNCIGQRFAMAELQVVVATLLTKYEFTLAPDADHTNLFNGISVQPTRLTMAMMPLRASPPSGL
ncbi:hypothetical protein H310_03265 [Aphanomyces invadans]|uniref:Cytochrome P450 n=1 Tax=Aphanomyces invadans TaxID=157072 RepID=A0A024UIT4_9STRA|nr:hypothetical protein H310_03265 [Aphanomyces invadans]ETW05508.1 hypothetical protein H310_03265 [Aphanomyces invadans]|eukprot:XP_008865285.1 hypothetical protein H310_03265 [Aphanomyces invadans]